MPEPDPAFPYSLTLSIPLPTPRLATTALRALAVDAELSPLVRRSLSLVPATSSPARNGSVVQPEHENTVLRTEYHATTNRILRVAVNGFMESLGVVLGVMAELDTDVLETGGAGVGA